MTDNTIKAVVKRVIEKNTNAKENIHVLYEIKDMMFFSEEYWKMKMENATNEIDKELCRKQMKKYNKMWKDMEKEIQWFR